MKNRNKYILHKPGSRIYLFTKDVELGSIYLKGMGNYASSVCEIIEPRSNTESILFYLLWLYQSQIGNKSLILGLVNKYKFIKRIYYKYWL